MARIDRNQRKTLNPLLFPGFKVILCISEPFEAFYGVLLQPAMHHISLQIQIGIRNVSNIRRKTPETAVIP